MDEVLAELVEHLLEKNNYYIWGKKVKFEDITDYYLNNIEDVNLSIYEAIQLFREVLYEDMEKLEIKPCKWVYNKLLEWKKKWYKLKVITARPQELFEKYTLDWLDKHYPNIFDEIHFANPKNIEVTNGKDNTNKWIVCQNLWIDIMIEDNPEYAQDVANCWIKTFLIEKPWNKNCKLTENIIKVKRFEEINPII